MLFDDLILSMPEVFLAVASMGLLLFGAFAKKDAGSRVLWAAVGVLVIVGYMIATTHSTDFETAYNGLFMSNLFTIHMKLLCVVGAIAALLLSLDYFRQDQSLQFEYPVLVLLATLGMLMMISANDLMSLYVGLELQSLSLYVLAAIRRDTYKSTEAGLKYFILGALSSGFLLYGASLVYGFSGSTQFSSIALVLGQTEPALGLIVGLMFILAALCFKVSATPFHMWTPDVYEGSPTPVTAFFATAPKIAAMGLFIHVLLGPFYSLMLEWQQVIVFVSMASMIVGAVGAIQQTNIKRLLAYSSIGHMGYALIGLASASEDGIVGIIIYLALYMVMSIGTFAIVVLMRKDERVVEQISDLAGLGKTSPYLALMMTVFMFSMAGIPPLAGFFGKFYVFMAAVDAGLMALAILGVLSSVVAAYYYIRVIKVMYFEDAETDPLDEYRPLEVSLVLGASGIVTGFFFLYPTPLIEFATRAASAFL